MTLLQNKASSFIPVLAILVGGYLLGDISRRSDTCQWDFFTYYHAAKVWADGGDPYEQAVTPPAGKSTMHPFLYPPITLPFFGLFTLLPYTAALQVWLFLRALLLIPLILIWWRWFVPIGRDWLFSLFLLLAFWEPIYLDLKAGNVTIIEQLLLWGGLALLLHRKWVWFSVCVVAAAVFKGTPLLFLGLLFLPVVQHRLKLLFGALGLFGVIQGLGYAMNPGQFVEYIRAAGTWDERGQDHNPSTLAALKDIWDPLRDRAVPAGVVDALTIATFAVAIAIVIWFTWKAYRRFVGTSRGSAMSEQERLAVIILLATLAIALIMPRLKVYTLMMVLPGAYYVVRSQSSKEALLPWIILLSLSSHTTLPIDERVITGIGWYYPLLMLYLVWGVWVWRIHRNPERTGNRLET